MQMNLCPSVEQLRRLLAEALPPPERSPLEAHVERCPDCQQVLERLTGDSLVRGSGLGSTSGPAEADPAEPDPAAADDDGD
jgi:hypothetical protein